VTRILGVGLLTGWGAGVAALPEDARHAAGQRRIVPLARPALTGDRFRRATRESLLAVAAVDAALRDSALDRAAVAGQQTALVYVTAAAYGASNKGFIVATSRSAVRAEGGLTEMPSGSVVATSRSAVRAEGGLTEMPSGSARPYFPYTAPSAVPAEVAIEYGLTGGYVILVGGAAATVDALWQASMLLAAGRTKLALVLAVETFEECADLWARGRWTTPRPLVEAAACAVLAGPGDDLAYGPGEASALETLATRRAGETLSCAPLVGLALARAAGLPRARVTGHWRGRRAQIAVGT
jgi:3-oxoacyl-(acyl-carrier-protein) synthase